MKNKRYYKITTEIAGEQVSFFVYDSKAEVQYRVGEWAEAPGWLAKEGYGLFVFDGLKNARKLANSLNFPEKVNIWRCEIEDAFEKLPPHLSASGLREGFLAPVEVPDFPKGTVMAKRVKLVRQVKSGAKK